MLLNDLYTISSPEENDPRLVSVKLNPDHPIFRGHFPGQPVLPGACMMEMVCEILGKKTGARLRIVRGPVIKFLSMIVPQQHPEFLIELNYEEKDGLVSASGRFFTGDTNFMKYQLDLKPW